MIEETLRDNYYENLGNLQVLLEFYDGNLSDLLEDLITFSGDEGIDIAQRIGALYSLGAAARLPEIYADNEKVLLVKEHVRKLIANPNADSEVRVEAFLVYNYAFPWDDLEEFRDLELAELKYFIIHLDQQGHARNLVSDVRLGKKIARLHQLFASEEPGMYDAVLQELIAWAQREPIEIAQLFSKLENSPDVARTFFRIIENPLVAEGIKRHPTTKSRYVALAARFVSYGDETTYRWASRALRELWKETVVDDHQDSGPSSFLVQVANFRAPDNHISDDTSYIILEEALKAQISRKYTPYDLELPPEPARAAQQLHAYLAMTKPPISVEEVAHALGVAVREVDIAGFDGAILSGLKTPVAVISTAPARTRRRFTLAHEIGHFVLGHRDIVERIELASENPEEVAANRFAAELLMPLAMLADEIYHHLTVDRLVTLAEAYEVSPLALAYRLIPHVQAPQWILVQQASRQPWMLFSEYAKHEGVDRYNYEKIPSHSEVLQRTDYTLLLYTRDDEPDRLDWDYEPDRSGWY